MLFTFPSRYCFTIGRQGVFSLRRWSSQIPTGFPVSRGTRGPSRREDGFGYRAFTFSGRTFQSASPTILFCHSIQDAPRPRASPGLGSFPFARRYLGNRGCFLFLRVLRCFSSPGCPLPPMDSATDTTLSKVVGSPIRTSPDHSSLTAPRGVSAFAPSFIGSWRLGIHRAPFLPSYTHMQYTQLLCYLVFKEHHSLRKRISFEMKQPFISPRRDAPSKLPMKRTAKPELSLVISP